MVISQKEQQITILQSMLKSKDDKINSLIQEIRELKEKSDSPIFTGFKGKPSA